MDLIKNFYIELTSVFEKGVFGISLFNFFIIFLSLVLALLIRSIFARLIVNRLKKIVKRTSNKIDDGLFDSLIPPFKLLPIVLVFLGITLYFDVQSTLGLYFQKINNTLSTIFVFWLLHQITTPLSSFFHKLEKLLSKALVLWILRSIKYLIIFLGVVAVLEVWGIKIGPVIAGLGLFGVAVALGAQDLFKNLISGIMILLEKRFHIGDVINVPGHTEGTVEHIGFRSTLIRKFDSTPITIPNYIFAEAPILNYSNRIFRRIYWIIGLEYKTSHLQLNNIINEINEYVNKSNNFKVDNDHNCFIKVDRFNDSSIDIMVYAFTNTNIWKEYLDIKEQLAFSIKDIVEKNDSSFAFPSTSIYIEKQEFNQ